MQYVSPFSFLPVTDNTQLTRKELLLAKRRLMAEFELHGNSTIIIKNKTFSRNDVLQMFDTFEKSDDTAFHGLVASDAVLLQFLQDHFLRADQKFSLQPADLSPDFIQWLSPYFCHAFKICIAGTFKDKQFETMSTLAASTGFMEKTDRYNAWQPIEKQINSATAFIESNRHNDDIKNIAGQIYAFASPEQIRMLNMLPHQYFAETRRQYALNIMWFAVSVFNKLDRKKAFDLLNQGKHLDTDEETLSVIEDKLGELKRYHRSVPEKKPKTVFRKVLDVLITLVVIGTIFTGILRPMFSKTPSQKAGETKNFLTTTAALAVSNFLQTVALQPDTSVAAGNDSLKTGDNPYQQLFKLDIFKRLEKAKPINPDSKTVVEKIVLPNAPLQITNKSSYDIIVFINHPDTVFSVYVKRGDSCKSFLPVGDNAIFLYPGLHYSKQLKTTFKPIKNAADTIVFSGRFAQTSTEKQWLSSEATGFLVGPKENFAKLEILDSDNKKGVVLNIAEGIIDGMYDLSDER